MRTAAHRQICTKVNALVDEGVIPLVEVLNTIPGLVTLDSCEGDTSRPAHIYFVFGAAWRDLAQLVARLARRLRTHGVYEYSLTVEWFGSNERPRALLTVPKERVAAAAVALG